MFHLFNDKSILLSKMRCTDYYLLFQEKTEITPIQPWTRGPSQKPITLGSCPSITLISRVYGKICLKIYHSYLLTTNWDNFPLKYDIVYLFSKKKKSYKKTNHLVGNLSNHRETSNHKVTGEQKVESLECQACSQAGWKGWMKRLPVIEAIISLV